jgi:sugar phosphate isomerase/epimerase
MLMTRRSLLKTLAGTAALGANSHLWPAGQLAWNRPIGLELFTLRNQFSIHPAGILKRVAEIGFREIEFSPAFDAVRMNSYLRDAGLTAPSSYVGTPHTIDEWKRTIDPMRLYGIKYIVIGDNPVLDAESWIRRAEMYNQCGVIAFDAGIKLCYHAHYNEYDRVGNTSGYEILLKRCEAKLVNMEMDIFWAVYAGIDPLFYWQRYPGRFPLLHVKDLYANIAINPHQSPDPNGPNPFAPVGQGKIDWARIFAHVDEAGVKHIFVEQDRCNTPPLEAIKSSFNYLKSLRVS